MPTFTGDGGANTLNGGTGADTLIGLGGGDTLNGGGGPDTLYGHSAGATGAIVSTVFATGFAAPVAGATAFSDPGFLYIAEKETGVIWRVNDDTGARTQFLDIAQAAFTSDGERGVLGLAFHPTDASRFYVFLTDAEGDLQVRAFTRSSDPTVANTSSTLVIEIPKQTGFSNHNGGWIGFSPTDGFLYIATGDGGGGGDPGNNAQDLNDLLGKILRIDVNSDGFPGDADRNYAVPANNPFVGATGADEIWAYGVRNPWRNAFDPSNGALFIADVGQSTREEINYLPAGAGGRNFGWRIMEGTQTHIPAPAPAPQPGDPSLILPIFEYAHTLGRSVTGGEVYAGANAGFVGQYVFADFLSNRLWSLSVANGVAVDALERTNQLTGALPSLVVDFVTGTDGALYAMGYGGTLWRLDPGLGAEDAGDVLNGEAGNDLLFGGAGADELNGGADNDELDGGLGRDRLFGGDGNDVIVWDASDDLANVLGGGGVDTIVFTGAAPTSFDLGGHGFEGAEGRFVDTGGQSWTNYTQYHDSQWRLSEERGLADSGARWYIDYDEASTQPYQQLNQDFTASGTLAREYGVADSGSTWSTFFDTDGTQPYVQILQARTAAGVFARETGLSDNGSTWDTFYDVDGTNPFVSIRQVRDAFGVLAQEEGLADTGSRWFTDFDETGTADFEFYENSFDTLGRLSQQEGLYDNGHTWLIDYDETNAFAWASRRYDYDENGVLISMTETPDGP